MTVLITGATGLVGKELVMLCHQHQIVVHYLTTTKAKINTADNYKGFYWNPDKEIIDTNCFNKVSIIVHLAGASISKRWTNSYKKRIIDSRTKSTQLLYKSILENNVEIKQFISASGISIYPSNFNKVYSESENQKSNSFLGKVVRYWENEADVFKNIGIKVVKLRIGMVLAKNDGALPQMVKPIKLRFGAIFGNGKQWQSWIYVKDLALLILFIINKQLEGVYNAVAPNTVNHKEFMNLVAMAINRKIFLPNVPKFLMQILLGEMHLLLFESQNVSALKIKSEGFKFSQPNLKEVLEELLG